MSDSKCYSCHKENEKLSVCSRCKIAKYCDSKCQKNDWGKHKSECKPVTQIKEKIEQNQNETKEIKKEETKVEENKEEIKKEEIVNEEDEKNKKEELLELIEFLDESPKVEIRLIAAQYLATMTAENEQIEKLLKFNEKLGGILVKKLTDQYQIAQHTFTILINLTHNEEFCKILLNNKITPILIENIIDEEREFAEMSAMLLSNLSRYELGVQELLEVKGEPHLWGYRFLKLVAMFCKQKTQPTNEKPSSEKSTSNNVLSDDDEDDEDDYEEEKKNSNKYEFNSDDEDEDNYSKKSKNNNKNTNKNNNDTNKNKNNTNKNNNNNNNKNNKNNFKKENDDEQKEDVKEGELQEGQLDPKNFVNDKYSWIATILMNVTQIDIGRRVIFDPEKDVLLQLIPFLSDENVMRRRGVVGAIRNCLVLTEHHDWVTSSKIDLLSALIYPLADHRFVFKESEKKEIPPFLINLPQNKKMDYDLMCRKLYLESLFILSKNRKINQILRDINLYAFIRELDTLEEDEDAKEMIVDIVQYLILDWEEKFPQKTELVVKDDENDKEDKVEDKVDKDDEKNSTISNNNVKEEIDLDFD